MSNKEYIKTNLSKHSFIMKSVLKMDDLNTINIKYVEHFVDIVKNHKSKFNKIQLAYNNYTKFSDLYKATLDASDLDVVDIDFCNLSQVDKIYFLKDNNIKHVVTNDIIVVYPSSFEEGQMIYPNKWCIKRSKNLWKSYNTDAEHVVLYQGDQVFGVSNKKAGFTCFTKLDRNISYRTFNDWIGRKLPSHLKIKNPKPINVIIKNIQKYKKDLFFLILLIIVTLLSQYLPKIQYFLKYNHIFIFVGLVVTFATSFSLIMFSYMTETRNRKRIMFNYLLLFFPLFIGFSNIDPIKERFFNIISDKITNEYTITALKYIKSDNTYYVSKVKDFLVSETDIPYMLQQQIYIDAIQEDDLEKFNFLLKEISPRELPLSLALYQSVYNEKTEFVKTIIDNNLIYNNSYFNDSVYMSIKNNHREIFKLLINADIIDDIETRMFGSYFSIFSNKIEIDNDDKIFFYEYALNNIDFDHRPMIKQAVDSENDILVKLLLTNKYRKDESNLQGILELSLKQTNKAKRDKIVKLIFDKTVFDYSEYSNEIITLAILFNYDYIIDDFFLNIDKIKDVDYDDVLKLLSLTEQYEAFDKLKNHMRNK